MVRTSLETAHAAVVELVNDFAENEAHYLSPGYSEAQARVSFIDKLWQALGWDVTHLHQKNPYAQEVKVEDPQKIQGANRRADYAFHTAPNFRDARFFCEAKKPAVQLKMDKDAAFQTIRYGWSAGTPLAVLTDFEQLHVLDCRAKPDIETALARSHLYFHYQDWLDPEKFAQLYYLFSREAFRDGGFDAYVSKLPRPKKVGKQLGLLRTGTQPVDAAFLHDLGEYRETLAKLLKAADHSLDGDALTELVQRILDRLVFLRFLEDKLIETEIQVQHFSRAAGGHSWAKFLAACAKLNARYNGIVFKPHPILDTPGRLPVDDARFADLCEDLSHTKSPYDFNAIPIHILGSIYERFLGSVIVTTEQRARVEEKPEVRKAGGVYYTPEYIVRYICEQTVGRLIEEKSPAQIAKMRFADIACGSGSFLLGVYDLLLRYHGEWYNAHRAEAEKENLAPPDKSKKRKKEFIPAVADRAGVLRLTLEKKREILLNNVFGVDLDPQAVEVAQLSLYLKLLEDETTDSAQQHYLDFHEALLPSLNRNVVRGNSLIGTDITLGELKLEDREERKLAPMDFESAFPAAFASSAEDKGFEAIVGNPPYVRIQTIEESSPVTRTYLHSHYRAAQKGNYDLYVCFVERALKALKSTGLLGYILPHKFFNSEYGQPLRGELSRGGNLREIIHFGAEQVFEGATTYTCLLFLVKQASSAFAFTQVKDLAAWRLKGEGDQGTITLADVPAGAWNFSVGSGAGLSGKLRLQRPLLGDVADIFVGLQTSADDVFILTFIRSDGPNFVLRSKALGSDVTLEPTLLHPIVSGTDVRSYEPMPERQYILFPYSVVNESPSLLPAKVIEQDAPLSFEYLHRNRQRLEKREGGKFKDAGWYRFGRNQNLGIQGRVKLCVPRLVDELCAAFDKTGSRFLDNVDVGGVTWKPPFAYLRLEYLLGIINSRLMRWLFPFVSAPFRGGWMSANKQFLSQIPIRTLDLQKPAEKQQHDRMVQLVEAMLATQQQLTTAANENDRSYYETKAAGLDRQIDELTCDLYSLTPEERALVASA